MKRKKKWNKENRLKSKDIKWSEKSKQDKHKITSKYISSKLLKHLSKQKKNPKVLEFSHGAGVGNWKKRYTHKHYK